MAVADEDDDTLKFYLSKSPLVVVGKIVDHPFGTRYEAGVLNHICKVSVTEVLHGDANLKDKNLTVRIVRYELGSADRHPLIRKDAECILFLKPTTNMPSWETADVWFGIQHPSPMMANALAQHSPRKNRRECPRNRH